MIKSIPRLESGDLASLPAFAGNTATLFRSVILTDVRPSTGEHPRYRLARVGLGLCVPVGGNDVVVTPETVTSQEVALGMIERRVLDRAEVELKKARLVARSESFAVLAAPSELVVDGRHEKVYLFYALAVDPEDGRLSVVLWASSSDPRHRARVSPLTLLPSRLVYRCGLDVSADRLLGALPINWSFAMRALPQGSPVTTPDANNAGLADPRQIAADPVGVERVLRASLAPPGPVTRVDTPSLRR